VLHLDRSHPSVLTSLELPVAKVNSTPALNWCVVDWEACKEELVARLRDLPAPAILSLEEEFQGAVCQE